ncbi:PadR family transcriptional regulator [Cryobacterium sp. 1639]|uniref:PadR family transcriptional regulator n=1 Tax=Cryobacterium inferilacus TaxID=2866629 RepID=UPI0027E29BD7|nr:helix-turn-helix transcriptional regulator [Cryobacterium sp. 1639]
MTPLSRLTPATIDVLRVLLDDGAAVWGMLVIKRTGRPAGSVYPILERLENAGWATSSWEPDTDRSGPRRRLYALTSDGGEAARSAVARFETRAEPATRASRATRPGRPARVARFTPAGARA